MIQNIKTHKELSENGTTYHSDCCKSVKNKTNIQRLKKKNQECGSVLKILKIVALKLTIFQRKAKLMRPNNLNLFLKLLNYFVQPLSHTIKIFLYYVKKLEEKSTKLL